MYEQQKNRADVLTSALQRVRFKPKDLNYLICRVHCEFKTSLPASTLLPVHISCESHDAILAIHGNPQDSVADSISGSGERIGSEACGGAPPGSAVS